MKKIFTFFAALTLSVGLWAVNSVFVYTAPKKLETEFNKLGDTISHHFYNGMGVVTYNGPVKTIGEYAFAYSSLQTITILSDVTTIGEYAFANCFSLISITILSEVGTIDDYAFANCSSLQSITIPVTVSRIGSKTFEMCYGLQFVAFLGIYCIVAPDAFDGVGRAEVPATLSLPNYWNGTKPDPDGKWYGGYFKIPNPAKGDQFEDANSGLLFEVTAVGETNTVKVIFSSRSGTTYTIPDTVKYKDVNFAVTEIGEKAFKGCSALTSVTFLGIDCTISADAFDGVGTAEKPATLTLPDGWKGTKPDQEGKWYGGYFKAPAPAPVVGEKFEDEKSGLKFEVTASATSISRKESIKMARNESPVNTVKVIADDSKYTGTSYTIPATVTYNDVTFAVTTIGESAFANCSNLQSITIPASVTTIEDWAFEMCSGMMFITFLGSSCTIGDFAFDGVGTLENLITLFLPDNWTGYKPNRDGWWYDGYFNLETLATPEEGEDFEDATSGLYFMVTAVGETNTVMVIPNEYSGTAYTVPATVMYKNVTFNVTEIDEYAFGYCTSLQSVTISEGVTTIDLSAFFECTSLQSVTLPESVTTIGEEAFYNCTSLQSITIPAGVTTIESTTFAYSGLQSVTISEGVTTIGGSAFEGCSSLQSVTLPESVTTIEAYAFASSGLQSITIPANVTEIGEKAFMECKGLTDVHVAWTTSLPTMGTNVFQDVPNTATLYVPFGTKALYQADEQWKNFNNIVEYDPFVDIRAAALVEITTARQGIQNTNINNKIDAALRDIQSAITKEEIERIKNEILEVISAFKNGKEDGKAEGLAEAQAALPTEGTSGPAVVITQGDKSITLINPDEVKYTIITEE